MSVGGVFAGSSVGYTGLLWLSFGLGVVFTVLAFILIPPSQTRQNDWESLDIIGAIVITVAFLLLVLGFTESETSWRQARVVVPVTLGALGVILFAVYEEIVIPRWLKAVDSLVPRRVWSYKNFVPILGVTALYYCTFFSMLLNGSQFLVDVQNVSVIVHLINIFGDITSGLPS